MNILLILVQLWPLWLILALVMIAKLLWEVVIPREFKALKTAFRYKKATEWRKDKEILKWLRESSPKEFEDYIAELFNRLGYTTRVVGGPNDGGIDIIAEKDGIKHYIQCKKYFNKREVRVGEVRDFYGALADRLADGKGYFITTNKFTLQAEKFAEDKPIELIDSNRLLKYIRLAEPEQKDEGEKKKEAKECPKCDGNLIERSGKHGKFLGCNNYPRCKYTEGIKNR